jgi:hypothetical protein
MHVVGCMWFRHISGPKDCRLGFVLFFFYFLSEKLIILARRGRGEDKLKLEGRLGSQFGYQNGPLRVGKFDNLIMTVANSFSLLLMIIDT